MFSLFSYIQYNRNYMVKIIVKREKSYTVFEKKSRSLSSGMSGPV